MLQSTAGFNAVQFGLADDLPATGDFDGDAITIFLVAMEVALEFDVNILSSEYFCQALNRL